MEMTRNNHYIAQMYLNAWKNEKNQVYLYNLLVSNENIPFWKSKSTKSVTCEENFYTSLNGNNKENDSLEKLFNEKYETPARISLEKAINNERLSSDDWYKLIEFVTCNIVRTPSFLIKVLNKGKDYAQIFEKEVVDISEKICKMKKEDFKVNNEKIDVENDYELFPLKITNMGENDENGNIIMKIETIIGKQFYFFIINHLLNHTAKILHKHKWSIMEVDNNVVLPTSDDPVICLNYNSNKNYNFGGGWGRKNSNILFPISPNKLLYTQVGKNCESRIKVNYDFSLFLKKIIVEHSYRVLISKIKDDEIVKLKKRHANFEEYNRERKKWADFHKNYLDIESEYINKNIK